MIYCTVREWKYYMDRRAVAGLPVNLDLVLQTVKAYPTEKDVILDAFRQHKALGVLRSFTGSEINSPQKVAAAS